MTTINLLDFANGPKILPVESFSDSRGSFSMVFQESRLKKRFGNLPGFTQMNLIHAKRNSLRGFHGALEEMNHWKLFTCLSGVVKEGFLDIRIGSSTFGEVRTLQLEANVPQLVVIPPGFAHAIQSMSDETILVYATNIEYEEQAEIEIQPLDGNWGQLWTENSIVSDRDKNAPTLQELVLAGCLEV